MSSRREARAEPIPHGGISGVSRGKVKRLSNDVERARMQVIDEGVVFAGRAMTDAASACFPSVCVLPGGRWLVGMRLAPAKSSRSQRTFVTWSDDQGKSWSEPVEPAAPMTLTAAREPGGRSR